MDKVRCYARPVPFFHKRALFIVPVVWCGRILAYVFALIRGSGSLPEILALDKPLNAILFVFIPNTARLAPLNTLLVTRKLLPRLSTGDTPLKIRMPINLAQCGLLQLTPINTPTSLLWLPSQHNLPLALTLFTSCAVPVLADGLTGASFRVRRGVFEGYLRRQREAVEVDVGLRHLVSTVVYGQVDYCDYEANEYADGKYAEDVLPRCLLHALFDANLDFFEVIKRYFWNLTQNLSFSFICFIIFSIQNSWFFFNITSLSMINLNLLRLYHGIHLPMILQLRHHFLILWLHFTGNRRLRHHLIVVFGLIFTFCNYCEVQIIITDIIIRIGSGSHGLVHRCFWSHFF